MNMSRQPIDRGGFSQKRLERLTTALSGYVDREEIAGMVALIHRHGTLAYEESIGWQDKEAHLPMKQDTLFRLASMTKPIVAVAVLMLVEEGKLRLSDLVDYWLPELSAPMILRQPDGPLDTTYPSPRSITVSDLLTYRCGIGLSGDQVPYEQAVATLIPEQFAPWIVGSKLQAERGGLSPDAWLAQVGRMPLRYEPGSHLLYHVPFDILGVLLARVANQSLPAFLDERIFTPLGMVDTGFAVPRPKRHRLSVLYTPTSAGLTVTDHPDTSNWGDPPIFPSGAGGLVSTATDYLRFGCMLLQKGEWNGVRLLSQRTIEAMTTDWLTAGQRKQSFFGQSDWWASQGLGYGVRVRTKPVANGPGVGSFTWNGALGTGWVADPQEHLVATFLFQLSSLTVMRKLEQEFLTLVYQAIDE